jgi:hypothetical protein
MFILKFHLHFLIVSNVTNLFTRYLFNLAAYISGYTVASDWMTDE